MPLNPFHVLHYVSEVYIFLRMKHIDNRVPVVAGEHDQAPEQWLLDKIWLPLVSCVLRNDRDTVINVVIERISYV